MTLWQWYVRRGRIDRRTWWLHYTVPLGVLSVLAMLADASLGNASLADVAAGRQGFGAVVEVVALLTAPASISASATRLHDRGMSAWWLPLALVPVVGPIAFLVLNGFLRGDAGPNRYGPPNSWPQNTVSTEPVLPPPTAPPSGPPAPPPSAPPYWG